MWLRREGDSDDPRTWQLLRTIRDASFGSIDYPGLQDIKLITVSFHDETPELLLNPTDQVEFAVPRLLTFPSHDSAGLFGP